METSIYGKFPAHIDAQGNVQSSKEHCFGTAELTKNSLDDVGLGSVGYLVGLLHDCGKFTEEFRNYIIKAHEGKPVRKGSVIHSFAGLSYLLKNHHCTADLDFQAAAVEIMAFSIREL